MRFEFEKISVALIQRRIREEQAKHNRNVTTVILTPPEWYEFMDQPEMRHHAHRDYFEIAMYPSASCAVAPRDSFNSLTESYRVVRVIRGR